MINYAGKPFSGVTGLLSTHEIMKVWVAAQPHGHGWQTRHMLLDLDHGIQVSTDVICDYDFLQAQSRAASST